MVWAILVIDILTIIISIRKRALPYALLTLFFMFLVVGQAFQISYDLSGTTDVFYRYAFISKDGFHAALLYLLGTSVLSLILVALAGGYRKGSQPAPMHSFNPPPSLYFALLLFLAGVAGVLIFVVVGFRQFLNSSRPGFQTGSTIFIIILAVGLFPLLLKLMLRAKPHKGDIACFLVSVGITGTFSRIHVILYLSILVILLYYNRGWSEAKLKFKHVLAASSIGIVLALLFFIVGAVRDAENYTGGSLALVENYILAHPDKSLLSISMNYRIEVEGMSGLSGAFTHYLHEQSAVSYDLGAYWTAKGALQWIPGFAKPYLSGITDYIDGLNWYSASIIAPGIESSFESFGWLGMLFYAFVFFWLAWQFPIFAVSHRLSPVLELAAFILIGCTVFFVRGSLVVWIGYSIAYLVIIALSWPAWRIWIQPLHADERRIG